MHKIKAVFTKSMRPHKFCNLLMTKGLRTCELFFGWQIYFIYGYILLD